MLFPRNIISKILVRKEFLTMAFSRNKSSLILASETNDKGIITINRAKALNAINLDMVRDISNWLKKWESTKTLVIIKGAGEKSFCAGGDVRAVVEAGLTPESKNFFREEYTLNALIGAYKIPYIALIDGITMGGGVGLSVHGKYRVATERTLFAMPETAIGLFPDVGGSFFLPRLAGKLGLYLGLTGFRLKGEDVYKAGVANYYCESNLLNDLETELLNCKNDTDIVNVLKKFTPKTFKKFILEDHLEKINKIFNENSIENIIENLKNDNSEFAANTLKSLSKMSPTSLKVTLEQLSLGKNLTLNECLNMEYRIVYRHLESSDFKEGVRALLIDKDQNPKWNPPEVNSVTDDIVKLFFSNLPANEELKL